jgi:DNA (cytosine-5)-methyltransferase 1
MKLLDLFCGAGGAAMGYRRAGFEVVGVDIKPQPHYPFEFHQADALEYCAEHGQEFDAIHASPPCQRFSKSVKKDNRKKHPDFIGKIRNLLIVSGKPFVIENVPGAPLLSPIVLCGSSFGLGVRRHRLFESNVPIAGTECRHEDYEPKYPPAWNRKNKLRFVAISGGWQSLPRTVLNDAMDIHWMNPKELSESIPPAYAEHIGRQLMQYISRE